MLGYSKNTRKGQVTWNKDAHQVIVECDLNMVVKWINYSKNDVGFNIPIINLLIKCRQPISQNWLV